MPCENKEQNFRILENFALVGLRNLNIRSRLIISYLISTVLPLVLSYLYSYYLYGSTALTGRKMCIRDRSLVQK